MAFQLKRKRSDSELSFSCSTTLSSPPRLTADFGNSSSPSDNVTTMPAMFRGRGTPLHFNSRTLKRYRDSRPSEAEVHASEESSHTAGMYNPYDVLRLIRACL
ncbi:hypothetical protein SPBR_06282 [Sporothrix brasiliensis 5110]|uniref:Uncharacterized protein n=1 Tax=Sporothrix brasiliensis 5110 TaxID=1398154 RepID=A0A0C2J013_9PEZI|nr:uncharacterized protein SPBR_06282 [Sporothrix brasiliensis 5110]KIH94676.1 hypothetical protein SPBR_06282 [Sporothrix brasiliensis 5110]